MSSRHLAAALSTLLLIAGIQHTAAAAGESSVLRYGATTANMDPGGLSLRFDILTWSDEPARLAVTQALESEDVQAALDELPTLGYVWPEDSPVGYAIKYAVEDTSESGEHLTLVTSRPLGSYDFGGWKLEAGESPEELGYSVIELDTSAASGTASLATPVEIDSSAGTIGLAGSSGTTVLFENVQKLDQIPR